MPRLPFLTLVLLGCTVSAVPLAFAQRCEDCPRTPQGRIRRSSQARRAFRRSHPCPATNRTTGACPGYVIDHVVPLACGGADASGNMQWQTVEDGRAKDRAERRECESPDS